MSLERGPASWTGRNVDVNYTLAGKLGYPVTGGGCVLGYPNGYVSLAQIVVGLKYPSCGWAGRLAGRYLRHRVGKLGRPGNCLYGSAARAMRSYQFRLHRPKAARSRTVTLGTWRALLKAR